MKVTLPIPAAMNARPGWVRHTTGPPTPWVTVMPEFRSALTDTVKGPTVKGEAVVLTSTVPGTIGASLSDGTRHHR